MTSASSATETPSLKQQMQAGHLALCMGIRQARTTDIALMASACGFDSLYVDMQHSTIPLDTTSAICALASAAGVAPLVRVPGVDTTLACRLLDGGATGIIVPDVESVAQAATMAHAIHYPPRGNRSVMGSGLSTAYRALSQADIIRQAQASTLLILMLESARGIEQADAIAASGHADMLLVGANDLCADLGIPGQVSHPDALAAYDEIAQACRKHGCLFGIGGIRNDLTLQQRLLDAGARFLVAGNDTTYLMQAAKASVQSIRDACR